MHLDDENWSRKERGDSYTQIKSSRVPIAILGGWSEFGSLLGAMD